MPRAESRSGDARAGQGKRALGLGANEHRTLCEVVKGERAKARRDPELQASYEAFRLNLHRSAERNDLVTPDEWEAVLGRETPPREGAAVLGVDLGASRSWSACALAWPNGRLEVYASIRGLPSIRDQERRDGLARGMLDRLVEQGVVAVAEVLRSVKRTTSQVAGAWGEFREAMGARKKRGWCRRSDSNRHEG